MRQRKWQLPKTGLDTVMNPVPKHKLAATYHQTPSSGQELIPSEVWVHTSSHQSSGLPRFIQVGHKTMQSPKPLCPFQAIIKCGTPAAYVGWHRGTGMLLSCCMPAAGGLTSLAGSSTCVHLHSEQAVILNPDLQGAWHRDTSSSEASVALARLQTSARAHESRRDWAIFQRPWAGT